MKEQRQENIHSGRKDNRRGKASGCKPRLNREVTVGLASRMQAEPNAHLKSLGLVQ